MNDGKTYEEHVNWAKNRKSDTQAQSGLSDELWDLVTKSPYGVRYDMSESDALGAYGNQCSDSGWKIQLIAFDLYGYFVGPDGFLWFAPDGVDCPGTAYNVRQMDTWDGLSDSPDPSEMDGLRYMLSLCARLTEHHSMFRLPGAKARKLDKPVELVKNGQTS